MIAKEGMTPTQLAAAEAIIRSVTRTCMGPLKPGAREAIAELMADGSEEARSRARTLNVTERVGCGADINELVISAPFDGQDEVYLCRCGLEGSFRAPLFNEEDLPHA